MSAALGGQPDELAKIAKTLQQTAAALATAQRDSAALIADLNADLVDIDNEIAAEVNTLPYLAAESIGDAQKATKAVLDSIQSIRGAYIGQLHSGETALMESGYVPGAIDESDAVPGDTPKEAVDEYVKSGQLERDRAIVANAPGGEKNHGHLGWSMDEVAADRRLDDYTSITDPATGAARYEGPQEQEEAARLAGSRLADWNMANSVGPVAKDPVLGGDMRDRSNARLSRPASSGGCWRWRSEASAREICGCTALPGRICGMACWGSASWLCPLCSTGLSTPCMSNVLPEGRFCSSQSCRWFRRGCSPCVMQARTRLPVRSGP